MAVGALAFAALHATTHSALAFHRHCVDCDIPFEWEEQVPQSENPPLPEGFALTVPVRPEPSADRRGADLLERYSDIGAALRRCWDPARAIGDRRWGEITLRVSFKSNGEVNGVPRIAHVAERIEPSTLSDLRASLLSALSRCTPLHFSASLGKAIAGQIFAVRFVQQGNQQ